MVAESVSALSFACIETDFSRYLEAVCPHRNPANQNRHSLIIYRVPVEQDRPLMKQWIDADADHSERGMEPDFFFSNESMSLVLADKQGPGLFIRVDPEVPESVRIHIQFSPNYVKSAKMLLRGWDGFAQGVWNSGVKRMVFESKSSALVGFCTRIFNFKRVPESDDYELRVEGN